MKYLLSSLAVIPVLLLLACDKPTEPVISDSYLGVVRDAAMAAMLPPTFGYDSTRFTYVIRSDNSYEVDVLVAAAMGNQKVETGTWTKSGSSFTFTPGADFCSNATTHMMEPADTMRSAHSGTLSGTDVTIDHFINIGNKTSMRDLGTIVFHKK
jgi:hypothetical protein